MTFIASRALAAAAFATGLLALGSPPCGLDRRNCSSASALPTENVLIQLFHRGGIEKDDDVTNASSTQADKINMCYFTNWARYRSGSINSGKDVFELGLDGELCTHFMYGFATVTPLFDLKSNDPNADHPSGSEAQAALCPEACNDPDFKTDWSDPNGQRCDWPCNPTRQMRGYEALTVGMKLKKASIKALISVGGWNFNDCAASKEATYGQGASTCEIFSAIAASEDKTRLFAQNIIAFCRKWGFDGFDLDWEYPVVAGHNSNERPFKETTQDRLNYIRMLKLLKEAFQRENPNNPLLLTAAVGIGKSTVDAAYDIPEMNKHLDLINLMTYDLHGAWEARTGCNANLYATPEDVQLGGYPLSVSWAVDHWLDQGASASKLTMGIGTYGRGWKLKEISNTNYNAPAQGASTPGKSTGEAGYLAYYEVQELIETGTAKRHYDEDRQCPYIVTDSGEWIGYDDEQSIKEKVKFANSRNLRGAMIWALDLDDFANGYPLISLVQQNLGSSGEQPITPSFSPTSGPGPTVAPSPLTAPPSSIPRPTFAPTLEQTPAPTSKSPSTPCALCSSCVSVPGNPHSATDSQCAPCALGGQPWWPCMTEGLCKCSSSSSSLAPTQVDAPSPQPTVAPSLPTQMPSSMKPSSAPMLAPSFAPTSQEGFLCSATPGTELHPTDEECQAACEVLQSALPEPAWPCDGSGPCQCSPWESLAPTKVVPTDSPSEPEPEPTPRPTVEPTPEPTSEPTFEPPLTPRPSSEPTGLSGDGTLVDATVQSLLNADSAGVFLYNTGTTWEESTIYTWPDMVKAVQLMATTGVGKAKLWLGEEDNYIYGLVNLAAFLAQCMQETIQYNACDENSWSDKAVVQQAGGAAYSATAACGQLKQSYQNYQCSAEEDEIAGGQMACDVDPNMQLRAYTQARWYGAPPALFCAPKSLLPKAPRWDHSGPWCAPEGGWGHVAPFPNDTKLDGYLEYVRGGGSCRDYDGIKAGGWKFDGGNCVDGACPGAPAPLFGQPEGRTDVEGCCWWGRGVIQTTGVCNFGKLNYYLGQRAANDGRSAIYPTIDFCKNPGAICAPDGPPELKWVAGFFYWLNAVQPYEQAGWNYITELKKWVDKGMDTSDTSFIDGASGIVNRGCHNPPNCGTGELHGGRNRVENFKKVLTALRL